MSASLKSFAAATALATTLTFTPANDAEAAKIIFNWDTTVTDVTGFNTVNVGDKIEFDAIFDDSILTNLNTTNPAVGSYNATDILADPVNQFTVSINGTELEFDEYFQTVLDNLFGQFDGVDIQAVTNGQLEGQSLQQFFFEGANTASTSFKDGVLGVTDWNVSGQNSAYSLAGSVNSAEIDTINTQPTPVPEPSTIVMFGLALGGLGARKLYNMSQQPS